MERRQEGPQYGEDIIADRYFSWSKGAAQLV